MFGTRLRSSAPVALATELRSSAPMLALLIVASGGLAAWVFQVRQGLVVTDMRNSFSWGLYVTIWAFFVGTAAFGLAAASAIDMFRLERLRPIGKIASLTAFIFGLAGIGMVLLDLGRLDRFYNLILHPRLGSPMIWDALILVIFVVAAAGYAYVQMRPDIVNGGVWLPFLGTVGSRDVSAEELRRMRETSERQARTVAPVALGLAILVDTVAAWVLATQLSRSWWSGGTLTLTFIGAAMASGAAVLILGSLFVLGRTDGAREARALLAKIAAVGAVVLLFSSYNDIVVNAWWGRGAEHDASSMVFAKYLPLHLAEISLIVFAILLFVRYAGSSLGLVLGSLSVAAGVLLHRFLLLPSAYNLIPFRLPVAGGDGYSEWAYPIASGELGGIVDSPASVFVSSWGYIPSPVEFAVVAGAFSLVAIVFVAASKVLRVGEATT
jgi:molybdopterin-containing oxidoreductase family membrane subunit